MKTVATCLPCRTCGIETEISAFIRDASKRCGYKRVCRPCEAADKKYRYVSTRQSLRTVTCVHCASDFESSAVNAMYCTKICGDRARRGIAECGEGSKCQRCNLPLVGVGPRTLLHKECKAEVTRERDRKSKRAIGNHKKRARRYGVAYLPIKRDQVFERDQWTCGLCSQPIDRALSYPNLKSASIDHIVPISLGGPHIESNLQAAHLGCNLTKSNRLSTELSTAILVRQGVGPLDR